MGKSQQIAHPEGNPRHLIRRIKDGLVESRRPHPNRRIARKAEPFARDHQQLVELAIAVLVMDQRKRIVSLRQWTEIEFNRVRCWHDQSIGGRVLVAIGELCRIARQAGQNPPFCGTQLRHCGQHVDQRQPCCCRSRDGRGCRGKEQQARRNRT